jgi:hypothetical protein
MTFAFDSGGSEWQAKSAVADETMSIRFTSWTKADRIRRQIIEQIQELETVAEVDAYTAAESLAIDALHLFDPGMSATITDAATEQRAMILHGLNPYSPTANARPAQPGTAQTPATATRQNQETKTLTFAFDAGGSGSEGPWLTWSARGTQDRSVPPETFYIRDGDDKAPTDAFETGVVMDIYAMKTGWQQSDAVVGQPPERRWNATPARFEPQPGDDWKRGFEVRCAIGGGKTATWEQAGAAVWGAMASLAVQFNGGPDGKLPLVKKTGVKQIQFKRGSTAEPVLQVVKWVDRPACLKDGAAAGFDTGASSPAPAPTPAPAPAPTPAPAVSASVPADIEF